MKPLFSRWNDVRRVFKRPERALWIFDFDGTLVPIARHPEKVVLPMATRHLLKELAQRFPDRVGILSGRALKHLRRRVGIRKLIFDP